MNTKTIAPYLVFFAAMLWATDAPFRVHLTTTLSSNFIVLGEHFFDVLVVLPILFLNRAHFRSLSMREWFAILFIAVCGSALASIAFTQAFHYINPSVAILLQKLQPLIAIGLASAVLRERLSPRFWLWAGVALGGAYVISFPGLIPQTHPGEVFRSETKGVLLALIAAFFWGASTVLGRYVLNRTNFKIVTGLRFFIAFAFLIIINSAQHSIPALETLTLTDYLFIFIIAVVSGVVSLLIYYKGLEQTEASVATLAELGFPVAAIFVNWLFIPGSALSPIQIVGVAVLIFAVSRLAAYNSSMQSRITRVFQNRA